ncbi:class I SAM-dependent methyltransferase [Nocardia sp. NPDC057227]|uniref:class I SAM-dependent methyltransferase n=1 Tax=Nocardia sp. NPDC057227 TaxID=3346056 RepID=UPI003631AC03
MSRALGFGAVARAYERFRPEYPPDLADLVLAYAGHPLRTALEIGAGTGKATRLFAARGIAVTATDPDPAMLAELRVPGVTTVRAAFEELSPDHRYDLVYAAAALHWTAPEGRWSRMAALLEPGGIVASFGGPVLAADPAVRAAVRIAFRGDDAVPSPDGTPPEQRMQWPGTELQRSELFTDVRQEVLEHRRTLSAHDYLGYLGTLSATLRLPQAERAQVLALVAAALPARVEIIADITAHLARRT